MNDKICLTVYEDDKLVRVYAATKGKPVNGKDMCALFPAKPLLKVDGDDINGLMLTNISGSKFGYVTPENEEKVFLAPQHNLAFSRNFTLIFFDNIKNSKVVKIKALDYDDNFYKDISAMPKMPEGMDASSAQAVNEATLESRRILAEANDKRKQLINEANNRAKELIDEAMAKVNLVTTKANEDAEAIVAKAKEDAAKIQADADKAKTEAEALAKENAEKAKAAEENAVASVDAKAEFEKLVKEYRQEVANDKDSKAHIDMYEKARNVVDETSKDIRQQLNATMKAVEALQASLWNKPFAEFTTRVREIDRLLDKIAEFAIDNDDVKRVVKSIMAVRNRLVKTLNSVGVEEYIPNKGQKFDPELHEDQDTESQGLDMLIDECVDSGFKSSGGVLLKAIVKTIKQE